VEKGERLEEGVLVVFCFFSFSLSLSDALDLDRWRARASQGGRRCDVCLVTAGGDVILCLLLAAGCLLLAAWCPSPFRENVVGFGTDGGGACTFYLMMVMGCGCGCGCHAGSCALGSKSQALKF